MSSYALWRRALARVDRRARAYLASRDEGCVDCLAEDAMLLAQAARLANRLAPGPRYGR
jgi:hypothetical protein